MSFFDRVRFDRMRPRELDRSYAIEGAIRVLLDEVDRQLALGQATISPRCALTHRGRTDLGDVIRGQLDQAERRGRDER